MKVPLLLLALSLAVRLVVAVPVIAADTPLLYDERAYDALAGAWLRGDLDAAYGHGRWPPLWPMLLAAARALPGPDVAAERLLTVLLGALTTPLAWWTGRRVVSERAAVAGAVVHALYPTAIAFSHLLWSETLFGLLAVWMTGLALRADDSDRDAALSGLALGLALLTRAAALPWLVALPAWLAWRRPRAGALALVAALAVISPWQAWLVAREGRPVVMTTTAGPNLYLGNNPWTPPGLGSSTGHRPSLARVEASLAGAGPRDAAARRLALEEVRRRPGAAVVRGIERVTVLLGAPSFPARHLLSATWPPLPRPVAAALWALFTVGWLVVAALIARGARRVDLLALLVLTGLLGPAATIATTRLRLPLVVLLLPLAGAGATERPRRPWLSATAFAGVVLCVIVSARPVISYQLEPSTWYAPIVDPVARLVGATPTYADRVVGAEVPEGCDGADEDGIVTVTCERPVRLVTPDAWRDTWLGGIGARR